MMVMKLGARVRNEFHLFLSPHIPFGIVIVFSCCRWCWLSGYVKQSLVASRWFHPEPITATPASVDHRR